MLALQHWRSRLDPVFAALRQGASLELIYFMIIPNHALIPFLFQGFDCCRTDTLRQRNRVFGRIYASQPRIIEKTRFLAIRA